MPNQAAGNSTEINALYVSFSYQFVNPYKTRKYKELTKKVV